MATAINLSFRACLLNPSQSTFLLETKRHFSRCLSSPETVHRLLRAVDPILDTAIEVAKASDGTQEVIQGLTYGRVQVGTARDLIGGVHLFFNILPLLVFIPKAIYDLTQGLITGDSVPIFSSGEGREGAYNERAVTEKEKIYCLVSSCAKFIRVTATLIAGGLCKPIQYLEKSGTHFSHPLHNLGQSYQILAAVKHGSAFLSTALDLEYEFLAYQRELSVGGREVQKKNYPVFAKRRAYLFVGLSQKGIQIIYDFAKLLQPTLHPGFRLPMNFLVAFLGLFRVWQKAA